MNDNLGVGMLLGIEDSDKLRAPRTVDSDKLMVDDYKSLQRQKTKCEESN